MTLDPDPYRTLGLSRGATLDEVKRAYRRLAKVNHPDAAGEGALPRFLAIQAAYEQLAGGWVAPRGRGAASAPRRPWEADTERSEATRRAYGGRTRGPTSGAGAGTGGAGGGTGDAGGRASSGTTGTSGKPGSKAGPSGAPRTDGGRRSERGTGGRRRSSDPGAGASGASDGAASGRSDGPPGKATLGSTSYDGADAGPFEPDWGGASWYGTTSGTYWTLNPKEYADPRKHGPEYQARARRAAAARGSGVGSTADPEATTGGTDPGATPGAGNADPSARGETPPAPEHTTSSWWESTAGAGSVPPTSQQAPGDRRQGFRAAAGAIAYDASPPDLGRAASDFLRALVDERSGGPRGRIVRAVIGWLPIAFGFSWLVGELTGCGRFAATCDASIDPLVLLVQVALFALLLALPILAATTAMAAIALLSTAVAAALILSASGGAADSDSRRFALGGLLLLAWFAGLAFAIVRRVRPVGPPTRPVS